MSCPASEEIDAAPPLPGCSTPPQNESNGGAAHAESDAGRMETESEADGEKQFDKSTGKKRNYAVMKPLFSRRYVTFLTAAKPLLFGVLLMPIILA